jgi:hypothetical protein
MYFLTQSHVRGVPLRVVRVLKRRRRSQPVPLTYLFAAGVGVLIGIALQFTLGWSWWAVALVFLAGVWLLFASTAFWGRPFLGRTMRSELADALDPAGATRRHTAEMERRFRSAPFPLYAPVPAREPRTIGGSESEERRTVALELVQGGPRPGDDTARGPRIAVEVSLNHRPDLQDLAYELWVRDERPPRGLPPEAIDAWIYERERRLHDRPFPDPETVVIDVDGAPVAFRLVSEGERWAARADVEGREITIRAEAVDRDGLRLATVDDVEPYIEGYRGYMEQVTSRDPE